MKAGKQFSRSALAAMIAIAVCAPAAGAMPAQDGQAYDVNSVTGEYTRATAGQDKNATTAAGATPAREGQAYDVNSLTGEYTRATAGQDKHATAPAGSDLRAEGAKSAIGDLQNRGGAGDSRGCELVPTSMGCARFAY